jgi:hypothetical protein
VHKKYLFLNKNSKAEKLYYFKDAFIAAQRKM